MVLAPLSHGFEYMVLVFCFVLVLLLFGSRGGMKYGWRFETANG